MGEVLTLSERWARKHAAMARALAALDRALADHAAAHGGRFVRFGSTVQGTSRPTSDVDILVDFPDFPSCLTAGLAAETLCHDLGLRPDIHLAALVSDAFSDRVRAEGVTLP